MARYAGGGKNTVESCRALRTKCRRGAEEAFLHQVLQKDPGLADRLLATICQIYPQLRN